GNFYRGFFFGSCYITLRNSDRCINDNEKMAKGDKKGAMEELRLAGVGVMENQYLMPLKQTRNALADAQKLLDKKQYYEANLALKGAEDGIIVDSEALFVN
ncbi:YfdX family protein, partial [Escherichia sp. SP-MK]